MSSKKKLIKHCGDLNAVDNQNKSFHTIEKRQKNEAVGNYYLSTTKQFPFLKRSLVVQNLCDRLRFLAVDNI